MKEKLIEKIPKFFRKKENNQAISNNGSVKERFHLSIERIEEIKKQIDTKERSSDRFNKTKNFVSDFESHGCLEEQTSIFAFLSNLDNYEMHDLNYIKSNYPKILNTLEKLLLSPAINTDDNLFLKNAQLFLKYSKKDCKRIVEEFETGIKKATFPDVVVSFGLADELLEMLPKKVPTEVSLKCYHPLANDNMKVSILSSSSIAIYDSYNRYTEYVIRLLKKIYLLGIYKELSNDKCDISIRNICFSMKTGSINVDFQMSQFYLRQKQKQLLEEDYKKKVYVN